MARVAYGSEAMPLLSMEIDESSQSVLRDLLVEEQRESEVKFPFVLRDRKVIVTADLKLVPDKRVEAYIEVKARNGDPVTNLTRDELAILCRECAKRSKEIEDAQEDAKVPIEEDPTAARRAARKDRAARRRLRLKRGRGTRHTDTDA